MKSSFYLKTYRQRNQTKRQIIIIIIITIIIIIIITAIGLSAGGSSPTLVQTKIKIHKTTITKQPQNIKNIKQQNNYKTIKISTQTEH
jgi:cell division protein FtsB